jgi:hypothetical protein
LYGFCSAAEPSNGPQDIFLPAFDASYQHKIGKLYQDVGSKNPMSARWGATAADGAGFLSYGPYIASVPIGISVATFTLAIDVNLGSEDPVGWVDVNDATNQVQLAKRKIYRNDFNAATQQQDFDLTFEIAAPSKLEFRVYSNGTSLLQHISTRVRSDRVGLSDLWSGAAHFEFQRQLHFKSKIRKFSTWQTVDPVASEDGETASVVPLDGTWYAFNRYLIATPKGVCNGNLLATVVRKTEDAGQTWSDPVPAALPGGCKTMAGEGGNTVCDKSSVAPDACAITDGGAFFDAESDTWHLLSQCLGTDGGWNLCHYVRSGRSPMGVFAADHQNPVVKGNQLFRGICSGLGKHCDPATQDEGTPQILTKRGGYFYVTFHGALPSVTGIRGVRGVARTTDFHVWETYADDLPGDAILSRSECETWHVDWNEGGCIGTGAASAIRSGNMFYVLAEAADKSLVCTKGQNWEFGLLRNARLGPSGSWENYESNPLIRNSVKAPSGCALQYMNLFRDRGDIFLMFSHYVGSQGFATSMFKLTPGGGASNLTVP